MAPYNFGRIGWIINRNSLVAMNEKLEIEIARYSGRISQDKVKNQPFASLDKCARYFYKLALQDVKTAVNYWLAEIHRVCDITDENGYPVKLRDLQATLEENIDNLKSKI